MRTIQLETLRINLSKELANLKEPIEVLKRGKVVGYIVKDIAEPKDVKPEKPVVKPVVKPFYSAPPGEDIGEMIRRAKAKSHVSNCTCEYCIT